MQYIVPGYVCYLIFKFTISKKEDNKSVLIISCVISYLLLSLVSLIRIKFLKELPDIAIINSAISSILGIGITAIVSIIYNHKWFRFITVKLFHKTPFDDIWRDVIDFEHGSNLKVFLKNKEYYLIGHHRNHEEKGNDSWLALSAFGKFDINTNQNYKSEPCYLNDEHVIITVKFSDVEHIEIF